MKRSLFAVLCTLAFLLPLASESTSWPGLSRFKLENGLEVYVYKDSSLPMARVEFSVRAGAMAQVPETAGFFHLYEHLAFGGDASQGGSAAVKAELASLGAGEWNGGTSAERVDWWLSLPASKVEGGIDFWARHLRPAQILPGDLSRARDSVLAETRALAANPDSIYEGAMTKRLFGKYPWRRDPAGSEASLALASPEALAKIRDTWFIPNNAALFVGGDVEPEAVRAMAERAFSSWKAGEDPWKKPSLPHPRPGVLRPTWMVYPDPSMPEGVSMVELRYRGPDLATDPQASYAADLWSALVADPAGRYKANVAKAVPQLYGSDPLSVWYVSQREGGTLSISAYFSVDPALPAVDRARAFKERARGFEVSTMRSEASYFSAADYVAARARLEAARRLSLETAEGFVDSLAWWWASSSTDYFLDYSARLAATGKDEVGAFLDSYIMRNLEVIALRMNPTDYEREKKSFASSGFELVSPANAFWWQK